jgi:DNA repair exonuclease SbcCD nuclease subunit
MAKKTYSKLEPGIQKTRRGQEIYLNPAKEMVIFGDNGCRPPTRKSIAVFKKILKIKTDLFVIMGDLVFKGQRGEFARLYRFSRKRVKVPIFTVAGNHDLPGYSKICGSSTYALISNDLVFVCLDNSKRKFLKDDLVFLKNELSKHKEKRFFILFHIPPPTKAHPSHIKENEWQKLKRVLDEFRDKIVCIASGHLHAFQEYSLDGYRIFISGGGGAELFKIKSDPIKAHHVIRLNLSGKRECPMRIIPIDRKISEIPERYLHVKL